MVAKRRLESKFDPDVVASHLLCFHGSVGFSISLLRGTVVTFLRGKSEMAWPRQNTWTTS